MATQTAYNPNADLNAALLRAGASKTVYALVTPETEGVKDQTFGDNGSATRKAFYSKFRDARTGKQDAYHKEFFDTWVEWSKPVVTFDRSQFPFFYPTAGASEPLRQIIFEFACKGGETIHVFRGEYEGYKFLAEEAGLRVIEHDREQWENVHNEPSLVEDYTGLFFISQPSAIDGNVWKNFNAFVKTLGDNTIVADLTYVGAVPPSAVSERFDVSAPSIAAVVFSLSKPFGVYYDRIGGVFSRNQIGGLFGNTWFKSLTALDIGTRLMKAYDVFAFPLHYANVQKDCMRLVAAKLDQLRDFKPSDVYILCTADGEGDMFNYLRRDRLARLCLEPLMAQTIGTAGDVE